MKYPITSIMTTLIITALVLGYVMQVSPNGDASIKPSSQSKVEASPISKDTDGKRGTDPPTLWKITYYCSCAKCCGKWADGITASGKEVQEGFVACNWLPFGTKLRIDGKDGYTVQDRGAKSLFGDKDRHIKHLDIWLPSHKEALKQGVKYQTVEIIK